MQQASAASPSAAALAHCKFVRNSIQIARARANTHPSASPDTAAGSHGAELAPLPPPCDPRVQHTLWRLCCSHLWRCGGGGAGHGSSNAYCVKGSAAISSSGKPLSSSHSLSILLSFQLFFPEPPPTPYKGQASSLLRSPFFHGKIGVGETSISICYVHTYVKTFNM